MYYDRVFRNLTYQYDNIYEYVCVIHKLLAECPQFYCREIRQMLTFLISLYCPKAYHRPDYSIRIVEYKKIISLNPISSPSVEPRAVFGFVTLVPVISSPKQTVLFFAPFCRAYLPSYRNHFQRDSNSGQFSGLCPCYCNLLFVTNNLILGAVLLSCLFSELQEPNSPGIELRTIFPEF
jgi:hypothetical protein